MLLIIHILDIVPIDPGLFKDCSMFFFFFSPESGEYQRVVAFLKGIPQDVLAKAALRSKAYTRALMHFEAYILENKENIEDHLTFLQVI